MQLLLLVVQWDYVAHGSAHGYFECILWSPNPGLLMPSHVPCQDPLFPGTAEALAAEAAAAARAAAAYDAAPAPPCERPRIQSAADVPCMRAACCLHKA